MYERDAEDLIDYWAEWPPVHVLVRGAVGFKGRGRTGEKGASLTEIAKQFGGKVVKRGG